jgi:hypothetical protein
MNALYLFLFEIILLSILVIILHKLRTILGNGVLYIFLGGVQYFQTILACSVYNKIPGDYIISPGSAVIFTATLYAILLMFHTEPIVKTRTIIYGLLFSNIIITFLSIITYEQLTVDNYSVNVEFLKTILNYDMTIYMVGSCLFFVDAMLLIIIYQFLNFKMNLLPLFLKFLFPLSIVSLFDSVIFYSVNYFSLADSSNLMISSIVGKQFSVLIFAVVATIYLKVIKKEISQNAPKNFADVIAIFTIKS